MSNYTAPNKKIQQEIDTLRIRLQEEGIFLTEQIWNEITNRIQDNYWHGIEPPKKD